VKVSAAILFTLVACASFAPAALADSGLLSDATTPVTSVVAPVTETASEVTQAVVPTTTPTPPPAAQAAETSTSAAAAPAATQAVPAAAAPIVETVAKTAAPAVETVSKAAAPAVKAVADTAAPVIKPVAEAAAPVAKPVTRTVAPVLRPVTRATAPVLQAVAPVLDAAAPILDAASPLTNAAAPILDGTGTILGNGGGRSVGVGALLASTGSTARATVARKAEAPIIAIGAVPTPGPEGAAASDPLTPAEGGLPSVVAPSSVPNPFLAPGFLPPRALELPPAQLPAVHAFPASPPDLGPLGGPGATPVRGTEAVAGTPEVPWRRVPGGPLGPLSSAVASAGAGAFPILLAALAAALFLAAPRLGRRLRPILAPWPLPIPHVSLERPG
jgi:hypothetical protein